jgi:glycosyltransferase involved in cell wall biosynthesis
MRIVLDLQTCQTEDGGRTLGRYSLSLAQAMARHENEHEIVIALNGRFPATIELLRLAFDGLLPRDRIVMFSVPRSIAAIDPANDWRRRAAEQVRLAFLAGLRPDTVHVSSLFVGLKDDALASVARDHGPFASTATLSDVDLLQHPRCGDEPLLGWRLGRLEEARHVDLLLVTSDHARDLAIANLELPEERIVTVPAAADEMTEPRDLSSAGLIALRRRAGILKPFVLSQVGADELESAEALIQAFALVPEAIRTQHQLALVADPTTTERQRLKTAIKRFGLHGDDVVIASGVGHDELMALYGASALVVSASENECLGSSALTAMTCGAPVIAANIGAMPEVIGRRDAMFDPRDHDAIASRIGQVLTDDGFRRDLTDHGSQQARRFSWDASAIRALEAFAQLHERRESGRATSSVARGRRPRLAFVSPLPPERSGIADYSAELLPELARHYQIEVVLQQASLDAPWVAANCTVRSAAWFDMHADEYDRIVYQFGNSPYHEHMFALLARHPGVVVLHDFFLSGAVASCCETGRSPGGFSQALYESHGYAALNDEREIGREAAVWKYPCNKKVLDRAQGVIVHSRFAMRLADTWYGPGSSREWKLIPLARAQPPAVERRAARERLGIRDEDFLVCSLGMLGPSKLNDRLLDAWLGSPLADDPRCRLAFVGETHSTEYCNNLVRAMRASRSRERVRITGFAPRQLYEDYLAGADVAVQLRTLSRGETSASVLDCLAHGLATIANANGWVAELPDETLLRIPDEFSQAELVDALVRLWRDPGARAEIARCGSEHVRTVHAPPRASDLYHDAIEGFEADSPGARYRHLLRSLADGSGSAPPMRNDLIDVAASVSANRPTLPPRQLLVDVTALAREDLKTGIERVSRSVLRALFDRPPEGYRVEPVYDSGGHYAYARHFALGLLDVNMPELEEEPIETAPGDIFLGLNLSQQWIPQNRDAFVVMRNRGVEVYFVLYDMLPVARSDAFPAFVGPTFARWLGAVARISDGVVCISRAVADEFLDWLQRTIPERCGQLRIGYFHLGADFAVSLPTSGFRPDAASALAQMRTRPSFLMVGTIEPRKGHAQVLSAFERLWAAGVDAGLVIVGKEGWDVERLAASLRTHPERGKRLHVLHGVSDEVLLRLYESASALLAASEGEGFGLPLIEAAQHGMPIIARDIPVFHEVAGEHAFYFTGKAPEHLADAISTWLALRERGEEPSSKDLPWLTWTQSTAELLDVIRGERWYARWPEIPRPYGAEAAVALEGQPPGTYVSALTGGATPSIAE